MCEFPRRHLVLNTVSFQARQDVFGEGEGGRARPGRCGLETLGARCSFRALPIRAEGMGSSHPLLTGPGHPLFPFCLLKPNSFFSQDLQAFPQE